MQSRLFLKAVLAFSLCSAYTTQAEAAAAPRQRAPISACAVQLSNDFTNAREGEGLDGLVSLDQINEFEAQCRRNPAVAASVQRDADRCVNRHKLDYRARNEDLPEQQIIDRINADCKAVARATPATGLALAAYASKGGNIFTHPRSLPLFQALEPRGSSGAAPPIPAGRHQSQSDGAYAYTAIIARDLSISSLLVDLTTNRAILCRSTPTGPDSARTGRWNSLWFFDDQPMLERPGGCHSSLSDFPATQLLNWRTHILKPATRAKAPVYPAAVVRPPVAALGAMPSPAVQQCILGKMTAYVRDRDVKGLDSTISSAQSAEFRAQCGIPDALGQSAPSVAPRSLASPPQGRKSRQVSSQEAANAGPVVVVDEADPVIREARISMQAQEKCELSVRGRVWEDDETQRIVQECTEREIRGARR